jgi:hypothetical protein
VLDGRAFVRRSPENLNVAEFCDRRIDAQTRRAAAARPGRRRQALEPDRPRARRPRTVGAALHPRTVTALGARVGNYKYHPFWNVLLDQLRVR